MEAPAFKKKQTILIVDDSAMNRALLADMIGDEYEILEAENGLRAIGQMQALGTGISLVLLDIVMPEMDGFDVLAVMNRHGWIKDIPVIMVSSESASTYIERAYELGVTDFISRPFDANIVRRRVLNTTMLYAKQKALIGMVADQIYEREKGNSLMVAIRRVPQRRERPARAPRERHDRASAQPHHPEDGSLPDHPVGHLAHRHGVEPARHRQDLHSRRGAQQARAPDGRRV